MGVKRYWISPNGIACEDNEGKFVRYEDYAALEVRCETLAAENAGLKSAIKEIVDSAEEAEYDGYFSFVVNPDSIHAGSDLIESETPATDAFLAEVRASGVEMFAERKHNEMMSLHPDTHAVGSIAADMSSQVKQLREFAAQLRKGVK